MLIALRNLARHKVKTVLTVLAITVSSAFYIFVDSWIEGMSIESRRNIVNYEMGAAKIQTKLYFEKKEELPSYENFANWEVYKEILDKAGYYAAPRFVFSGILYSEGASAPVTFNAVDPIAESQVLRYTSYVENGRYIKSGAVELVVGTVVAKKLNLLDSSGNNNVQISAVIDIKAVPEKIRMDKWEGELMPALKNEEKELLQSAYQWEEFMDAYLLKEEVELDSTKLANILETMIRIDFSGAVKHINQLIPAIVVGVVNSPNPVTNFNIAYIPMDVLQGEQGMMLENRVTELLIRDKNANDAELPGKRESAAAITAVLNLPAELGVFTWIDYSKDYIGYEKMESTATKILTLLLFILALLGISNTILMSILERTKEIGMMRALGMTDNQLVRVYMLEAGFLGLIGSIFGIIFGCAMNYPMVKYGVDFSSMRDAMGANASFRISSLFRSSWNVPVIIGTGIVATLVSSLMAFFPARRAVKMPILCLLLLSCEPNRLEVVEVFDNNAPKEAYEISPDGEKQARYSWYRNGIKAEEMPFANGVPNGAYRKWSVTGFIVESGNYKDSLREGKWTFFAKERVPYAQGYYKKGKKQGKWVILNEDGKIIGEQFFSNDSAIGLWKKFQKNILIEENSCHDANKTGYFKSYSNDGKPLIYQECKFGKPNGIFMSYYPGGSLSKIGRFESGLRTGQWVEYFANSKIKKIENWISGIRNGSWLKVDEEGKTLSRAEFIDGTGVFEDTSWQNNRMHGEVRTGLRNGEYYRIDTYENGAKHSTADYPKDSQQPLVLGFWKDGKKEGAWRSWYRNGILKDSMNFKEGELFGEQFHYDSTGRLYKKEKVMGKNMPTIVEMRNN